MGASSETSSPGEAGFTLLEALVGITLLSLITAASLGGIRLSLHVWEKLTSHTLRTDQLLQVQDFIRQTIGDAYPAFITSNAARSSIDFSGTKTSVEFIAPTPLSRGGGGRSRFTIGLDASQLIVTSQAELTGSENISHIRDVLTSDVVGVQFSYFGDRNSAQPQWYDEWKSEIALPQLVRLRLKLKNDDGHSWPDLIVTPRINADVGCLYDVLTKHCRGR